MCPWLSAVDFDVLRIPKQVLAPTAATTLLAIVVVAATERDWKTRAVPVVSALPTGGLLAAVHFATNRGIGFGDVKLAIAIGLTVGPLGVGVAWLGIL